MELYMALDRGDTRRGVGRLEIERNVDFEIKGQFLRGLRDNTFSGNENKDAHEHVGMILEIARRIRLISAWRDTMMISQMPPTITFDLNDYQKVNTFYKGLEISTLQILDFHEPIPGLTPRRALVIIQEIVDHSYKWHEEESNRETGGYNSNQMSTITNKLKNLNCNMRNHKKNTHAIKGWYEPVDESHYLSSEVVKCVKATKSREGSLMVTPGNNSPLGNSPKLKEILGKFQKESSKRQDIFDEWMKRFRENTNKNLRRHDYAIKGLEENVTRLAQAVKTHNKLNQDKTLDMKGSTIISPLYVNSNLVHCTKSTGQEIIKKIGEKDGFPYKTPTKEPGTFAEKVKRRIKEEQDKGERLLESIEKEPVNTPLINTIRKTLDYTKCLQELGSEKIKFKKCLCNALADFGASISVMPFSMFKRLGLGTPKSISMVIEMADISMQSPKGIVENVLVKIDKFMFSVDFMILDIVEDNKVPIILGRPVLATAHARIDVFGRKISLEVGTEKVVFNANEGKTPLSICVINDFQVPEGDFLEENDLLPTIDWDSLEVLLDSNDEMGIRLEELGEGIEIFWDS
ncbi:homeodomain-like protein [Tanacetum coccineum]